MDALTAFLFTTTPTAQSTVKIAKSRKRNWAMSVGSGLKNSVMKAKLRTGNGGLVGVAVFFGGFFLIPFVVGIGQRATEFVEAVLMVHHLGASVAGH